MLKIDEQEPIRALSVEPKTDQDGAQKIDREGFPLWTVIALHEPQNARPELIKVTVPAADIPEVLPMKTGFVGLVAGGWSTPTGGGIFFRAEGLHLGEGQDDE